MSESNVTKIPVGNELDPAQAVEVGGGDCGASVTVGSGGVNITTPPDGLGGAVIATYEGMIEATSYAIERIANALK